MRRLFARLVAVLSLVFMLASGAEAVQQYTAKVHGLSGCVSGETSTSWIVDLTWSSEYINPNPSNFGFRHKIWVYNEDDELMYSDTGGGYCGCPGIWDTDGYVKSDWSVEWGKLYGKLYGGEKPGV